MNEIRLYAITIIVVAVLVFGGIYWWVTRGIDLDD